MKVVFVVSGLGLGGAEGMLLRLLERIDRERFDVAVISLSDEGVLGSRMAALGIEMSALGIGKTTPLWRGFARLVARLRAQRPDLVQTWMYHADLLGGLAARVAGVPVVSWGLRNTNLDPDKTKRSTRAVVRLCAWLSAVVPTRIVSCSEAASRLHAQRGYRAGKMVLLPNGFDVSRFRPDPQARERTRRLLRIDESAPVLGLIARYDPLKNHRGFLEAATRVRRAHPRLRIVLAGTGVDAGNAALGNSLRATGLGDCAVLMGAVADTAPLMASLDILVSASHGEAFPNVVGEAMACGVPCVVTDTGDSAFIVADTGTVVPCGDVEALAGAIVAMLDASAGRRQSLGQRARTRIEQHFEIGAVVRRYETYFAQLPGLAH